MHDVRDAYRALRATPIVSAVAILSLALGIGANTAIFSILNSLLFKPLPVRDPHQLVGLGAAGTAEGTGVNYSAWKEIRDQRLLGQAFAWASGSVSLSRTGEAASADAIWAAGSFFDVLGVPAFLGRTFGDEDDRRGGGPHGPVAVISYPWWRTRFAGAPDVIGRTLAIEDAVFTIVGVTPPDFFGLTVGRTFDVILPLETEPLVVSWQGSRLNAQWGPFQIVGRLSPGQTADGLTNALRTAQPNIRESTRPAFFRAEDRDAYLRSPWIAIGAATGTSGLRTRYGSALYTLLAIVGLVLLVACANVAMLLVARGAARSYELSVRRALGASRLRLARQLLVESLLLSVLGATIGLGFAQWGSRLLVAQLSNWAYTVTLDLSLDGRVLGVTMAVALATAVLFGLAPAYRAARVEPLDAMKRQPRGFAGDSGTGIGWLVVGQVALSLMLVVGAGLFVRSFVALAYRDLGFDRRRLLIAVVDARRTGVPESGRFALFERVRDAVATVNGVEHAAISMATPLGNAGYRFTRWVTVPGSPTLGQNEATVFTTPVSPEWFDTYGTRLLAGRDFTSGDRAGSAPVAIVNEAFARKYFGRVNPLGQTLIEVIDPGRREPMALQIVGLVEDAAFTSVRDAIEPTLYRPLKQFVNDRMMQAPITVSVRAVQPLQLTKSIASAIGGVDPNLSIAFRTVVEQLNYMYIRERLLALVSGFFGVLALLLAALGLYGVTAFAVSRRRTEIGVRMALGADAGRVRRLVLSRVVRLVASGLAVGAVASFWAARFVGTLLYGLTPRDPMTFGAACAVLVAVAAAGWIPAWRASRIDPAVVLRES